MIEEVGEVDGQEGTRAEHGRPPRTEAGRNDSHGRLWASHARMPEDVDQMTTMPPVRLGALRRRLFARRADRAALARSRPDRVRQARGHAGPHRGRASGWCRRTVHCGCRPVVMHWIHCRTAVAMRTIYLDPGGGARSAAVPSCWRRARSCARSSCAGRGRPGRCRAPARRAGRRARHRPVAPLHLPEPKDPRLQRVCAALVADPGATTSLATMPARPGPARAR